MANLVSLLAISLPATALFGWVLSYCLRNGVVGGGRSPWARDAHRNQQPIQYWAGITGLTLAVAAFVGFDIVAVVSMVR
jgi:hypothetical protein